MGKDFKFADHSTAELRELRFFTPMKPMEVFIPGMGVGLKVGNRWEGIPVECRFTERRRSLEMEGGSWPYKVELEPVDPELIPVFGREEYYGCDFESLVNEDHIHLKQSPTEHVEMVKWREQLTAGCCVEHEGWTIVD